MRRLQAPRPLVLLLVAVAVVGVAWALFVPPWQAPDEPAHFGYAQLLAERFELPGNDPGRLFSREQELATVDSNARQTAAVPATRPEWSSSAFRSWWRADARLGPGARGDGGGRPRGGVANPARTNPPLYYGWEAVPYLAASGGDIFDRLYLMRLWSVLFLVVTAAATWALVGEVLGRRPLLQLVAGALAGLEPMNAFVSASVNPDALLIASWAVALWLGARLLTRGLTLRDGLGLAAAVAVAVLTKASGWALVPAAAFAIGLATWRRREAVAAHPLRASALCGAAFAIPVGTWLVLAHSLHRAAVNQVTGATPARDVNIRELLSYVWQFYLPKLPFQRPFPAIPSLPVYDVWIKTGWAAFGWLEVRLPEWVYALLAAVTALFLAAGVVALVRAGRTRLPLFGFFALAVVVLLGGLHWTEYRLITSQGKAFNQGRYLLPLVPLLGLGAAALLELTGRRARVVLGGLILGGLLGLQLASLAAVAGRFYA